MASTINLLRLLADPTRLRLLVLLEQEELSVAELQEILGMGQSRISSHLAHLKRAGVVADRRVGKNVYYGANHTGQKAQRERVAEITRLLARDLPEPGAELSVVLLRVAERLLGRALALLAQLVGHPEVEPIEHAAVAAERVVPLGLADDGREMLEPARRVLAEQGGDPHLLGVRVLRRDRGASAR